MQLHEARIAVTGATGFLGRYIVDTLLRRGARVIGVVRDPDRVPWLRERGVELRRADLAEPERLSEGFAGADVVVSNAALFSLRNQDWQAHQRANIQGTENVLAAVASSGVRRVVQVSSVAVYRQGSGVGIDEDAPQFDESSRVGLTTTYKISKALSEQAAWRLAKQHEIELTTVRPCGIYGAFDPNFTRVFKALVGRLPVGVLPALARISPVYAGDVAEAIALTLEKPVSVGRAYNVTGDDHTIWELAHAWREAGGRTARVLIPIPVPWKTVYDTRRARAELGWHNRPYVDALRETLAAEANGGL